MYPKRLTMAVLAAVAMLLVSVGIASAHAHYVSSDPANGAHLATAPSQVSITYDDDLDPNATTISVLGPNGQNLAAGKTTVSTQATKVATVPIKAGGNGTYTVKWHAVADDDKGVTEGSFTFTVGGQLMPGTGHPSGLGSNFSQTELLLGLLGLLGSVLLSCGVLMRLRSR
jgi:copper resistance protein C